MKMMMALFILLVACGAQARLGETVAQIYTRYGSVVSRVGTGTNDWVGTYKPEGDFIYEVTFVNGKSAEERVSHYMHGVNFTAVEIAGLLKDISGGTNWVTASDSSWIQKKWVDNSGDLAWNNGGFGHQ